MTKHQLERAQKLAAAITIVLMLIVYAVAVAASH